MQVIQVGPFLLNGKLLLLVVAACIGYVTWKHRALQLDAAEQTGETLVRAALLGLLIWKCSPILWEPLTVVQHPSSLLYLDGGDRGLLLALLVSGIVFVTQMRHDPNPIFTRLDLITAGWIAGSGTYHLFQLAADRTAFLYYLLCVMGTIGLAWCAYANRGAVRHPVRMTRSWMWYSLGMVGLCFVPNERVFLIPGFTKEQVMFFAVFLTAFVINNVLHAKKKQEVSEWKAQP